MRSGTLEITTKIGCKINCKYCPQNVLTKAYFASGTKERNPEYMSFQTFQTCIDKVPIDVRIDFSGMCEPWLNPECMKMVQYASEKGHKIAIFTTLVGITEKEIERLETLNIEQFVLHIPDQEGNSKIEITEHYKKRLELAINTKLNCNKGLSCHGELHKEIADIIELPWELDNKMIDRAGNIEYSEIPHQQNEKKLFCSLSGSHLNHNVLLPNGDVVLCCMDYALKHKLGNLLTDCYETILSGREINQIQDSLQNGTGETLCKTCSNGLSQERLIEKYLELSEQLRELWTTRQYYIMQTIYKDKRIHELESWIGELEQSKDYHSVRNEELQEWIQTLETRNDELQEWIQTLETTKKNNDARLIELDEWIEQLEIGKKYNEKRGNELEKKINILTSDNKELEEECGKLQNEWNKMNYKLNTLKENLLIKQIIKLKNYDV